MDGRLATLVSRDAVADLPPFIEVVPRPPAADVRRAAQGLVHSIDATLFLGLDVDLVSNGVDNLIDPPRSVGLRRSVGLSLRRVVAERMLVTRAIRRRSPHRGLFIHCRPGENALRRSAAVVPEAARTGMVPAIPAHTVRVSNRCLLGLPFLVDACRQTRISPVPAGGAGWGMTIRSLRFGLASHRPPSACALRGGDRHGVCLTVRGLRASSDKDIRVGGGREHTRALARGTARRHGPRRAGSSRGSRSRVHRTDRRRRSP